MMLEAGILKHEPMSAKLTPADVQMFEAHIKKSYEGVVFELMITHNRLLESVVELIWIIVHDRKRGIGTAIMRELCQFADRHAAEITLKTASKVDYAATTSRARLVRFYKRFGFVKEEGQPVEFTAILALVRKPIV
jgi:GNAT superfamily N-acetyltransferase